MAAVSLQVPLRRRHSRYELTAPVEVTVLRSGIPRNLPGRLVDAGVGGVSVVLPGELFPESPWRGVPAGRRPRHGAGACASPLSGPHSLRSRVLGRSAPTKMELVRIWTDQRYRVMVSAADTIKLMDPPEPQLPQVALAGARSKQIHPRTPVAAEASAIRGTGRTTKIFGPARYSGCPSVRLLDLPAFRVLPTTRTRGRRSPVPQGHGFRPTSCSPYHLPHHAGISAKGGTAGNPGHGPVGYGGG